MTGRRLCGLNLLCLSDGHMADATAAVPLDGMREAVGSFLAWRAFPCRQNFVYKVGPSLASGRSSRALTLAVGRRPITEMQVGTAGGIVLNLQMEVHQASGRRYDLSTGLALVPFSMRQLATGGGGA